MGYCRCLPPQATHADKFLRTDGTAAYWATVNLPTSAYSRTSFTATAGQTTFNVTYPLGSIQVYVNGVLLRTSDYTATNETSFTLNVPASAGAAVDAFVYNVYGVGQVLAENIIGTVAIGSGGTGATTAAGARTNLGLGTAATTDSTAYATAAQGVKADTALQPATIGVSVQGYNANTVIDSAYVHTDNNYTTTEKSKLAGIAAGAEVNVNADWTSSSGDSQILNKPTLGTASAQDVGYFATAAQGTLADNAVSAITSSDGSVIISPTGTIRDLSVGTAASTGNLISQVRNETGGVLTKGTVVYISGAAGNKAVVSKAIATGDSTSAQTYGMVQADIPNNQNGYVVVVGSVSGLNTIAYPDGTQLYLSGTTAGGYTNTKPYAPIHLVYVGVVTYSHANQGTIQVKIQNGYEMDEIHDVSAQNPTNGDTLVYVSSTDLWTKTPQSSLSVASAAAVPFSGVTGKPTTLSGYGITDAYSSSNPSGYISGITSGNVTTALGYTPENAANKGNANGYASLDGSGLVPASQLPSYVDDVLEYANLASFPGTGTTGKIYVALDTNKTYRWSGTTYIYITSGAVDSVAGKTGVVTLNNSDVGLGSVENKSSATIRSEITSSNVTTALGFTPYNATNPSGYITSSALSSYLPLSGGTVTGQIISSANGNQLRFVRADGTTPNWTFHGWGSGLNIYSSAVGTVYIGRDGPGTNLDVYNGSLTQGGNQVLHAGNYTSYALGSFGSTTTISDWNSLTAFGSRRTAPDGVDTNGPPINQYGNLLAFGGDTGVTQLQAGHDGRLAWRTKWNASDWTSWNIGLDSGNYNSYSPTLTGGNASGTWGINITGNAATATSATDSTKLPLSGGSLTGAIIIGTGAGTPSDSTSTALSHFRLQTHGPLHINGDTDGSTTEYVYITAGYGTASSNAANGLAIGYNNLTWKNNTVLHSGNFSSYALPTGGGTLSGTLSFQQPVGLGFANGQYIKDNGGGGLVIYSANAVDINGSSINVNGQVAIHAGNYSSYALPIGGGTLTGNILFNNSGTTKRGIQGISGDNDYWFIGGGATATNAGFLEIATGDDAQQAGESEPIYVSQYGPGSPLTGTLVRRASLLDVNGNTSFPGTITTAGSLVNGQGYFRRNQTDGNYGSAALWTESFGNTTTGIAFHISGIIGKFLEMRTNGFLYWNGTMVADSDYRAPAYYDSNDTSYYGDFNNTSVFSKLWLNGKQNGVNQGIPPTSGTSTSAIERIHPGYGTFGEVIDIGMNVGPTYGWIQATNYTNLGVNYPLLLNPNGGNIGIGSVSIPAAKLHVSQSTPTGIGGVPSGVTMMSDSSTNNYLLFRNTADNGTYGGIAFQDNNIGGYVVFGNAGGGGDQLYVAGYGGGQLQQGYSDSINPSARTTIASWNGTGLQVNSGDMRAPIYYDSNNTGYYVDPASTSQLLSLGISSGQKLTLSDPNHYLRYQATGFSGATIDGPQLVGHQGGELGSNNGGDNWSLRWNQSGDTFSRASSRAPIFYDNNDSGYYVDPNSSGVSLRIGGAIQSNHTPWTGEMNKIQWHGSSLYFQNMNDGFFIFRNSNGVEPFALNANGAGTASASWRSPIFYDSNDTAYYVDPNGTSRIGGIQISPADGGTTGNAIRFYGNGGDGAGAYDHAAIIDRLWGAADQSELLIFKGNDPDTSTIHDRVRIAATGRIVFHSVNGYTAVDAYISGNTGNINGSGYFNGNDLIVTGNVTAYSDIKLKENIQVIDNALSKVKLIQGVTYTRNDLDDKTRRYSGVIAQQVEKVLPEVVEQDEEGLRNVAYGNMVGLLIEAIKEQDTEITTLRSQLQQQQSELDELKSLVKSLLANR